MKNKTYLLIGGAGFIGRPLARRLLEAKAQVAVLDNFEIKPLGSVDHRATILRGDARSVDDVVGAISIVTRGGRALDAVVYLAAHQGYGADYESFAETNLVGPYALFSALRRTELAPAILLASSQSIYRPTIWPDERATEDETPKHPVSVYGASKLNQEQAFRTLCRMFQLPFVALRYSIVLGPGQSDEGGVDNGILRNSWKRLVLGLAPVVHGDGSQVRDFVHIDDVTSANFAVLEQNGILPRDSYNVCGIPSRVRDVTEEFARSARSKPPEADMVADRPGGNFSLVSCGDKLREDLAWTPSRSVKEQVEDYVRWRSSLRS